MTPTPTQGDTAQARYEQLSTLREPYRLRAVDCATLTVPYLFPPLGFNPSQTLPTPYQSMGARGVRTLAAKLLLSLYPPNVPFFKFDVDDFVIQRLAAQAGTDGIRGDIEKALSSRERATILEMETAQFRPQANTALQHLINDGNFLMYVPPKGRVRGFRLDQYVVKRDPAGNVLEIVVKECVSPTVLPKEVRQAAASDDKQKGTEQKSIELYTHVIRRTDKWDVYQEACQIKINKSVGTYLVDECPWLPLRLITEPGEDYGRSYVEEFLGDLDSLEGLSETLVEGSSAAARIIFLVKPNGVTKPKVIAKAKNGDVHIGDPNDVGVVQSQKQADLKVAMEMAKDISTRLSFGFLLNTAIQRSAERVTAEEIRYMASELDDALGGMYALLSTEFQLPIVKLFEKRMEKNRQVTPLPKGIVNPTITSGIEALGRGIDLRNLKQFTADVITTLTPQVAFQYMNPTEYIKRAAAAYGIDTDGLIKSDAEVQQAEQMQKLQELGTALGPQAIQAAGGIGKEAVKAQLANKAQQAPQGPNG